MANWEIRYKKEATCIAFVEAETEEEARKKFDDWDVTRDMEESVESTEIEKIFNSDEDEE